NDELTWMFNSGGVTTALNSNLSPENGMLTWMLDSNGERLTAVNGDGELSTDTKNMLTWQVNNNDDGYSPVNGMLTCQSQANEMKSMLTWQKDETKGMLTCHSEFNGDGEAVTDEMLTQVKIVNDYPYWLPLKFQTSSAYVTINGNEELCGSSFSDSDTSYMAGISGAWIGLADEARGEMEVEWGESGV
nr:hypothetical protein [Tanacetum cinerariifolium]